MTLFAEFVLEMGGFRLEAEVSLDEGVLVLFGPSGSGKSLTVAALAGLVTPTSGRIEVGGRVLFDATSGVNVSTRERRVGYVPQHHSLFPFATVRENVTFGLPKTRRKGDAAVARLIDELGLAPLADVRPRSLSGGERQRVALARALAMEPALLLLDEPFASLDRSSRTAMRGVLRDTLRRHGTPAVLVTHDPAEAHELGSRAVLYERGRTVRSGTPMDVVGGGRYVLSGQLATDGSLHNARLEGDAAALAPNGFVHVAFDPLPDES